MTRVEPAHGPQAAWPTAAAAPPVAVGSSGVCILPSGAPRPLRLLKGGQCDGGPGFLILNFNVNFNSIRHSPMWLAASAVASPDPERHVGAAGPRTERPVTACSLTAETNGCGHGRRCRGPASCRAAWSAPPGQLRRLSLRSQRSDCALARTPSGTTTGLRCAGWVRRQDTNVLSTRLHFSDLKNKQNEATLFRIYKYMVKPLKTKSKGIQAMMPLGGEKVPGAATLSGGQPCPRGWSWAR